MATVVASYHLMVRALRESMRQPGVEIQNIFIPLFFLFVTVGAIGRISGSAFGVENYKGFQLPVAILQGTAGTAGEGLGARRRRPDQVSTKSVLTPVSPLS